MLATLPPKRIRAADLQARQAALALVSLWYFANVGCGLTFEEDAHGDIIRALEKGDFDEVLILMARGHFKTYLVACYIAWMICKDRNWTGLGVVAEVEKRGKELNNLVQKFLSMPKVKAWFGDFQRNSVTWNNLTTEVGGRDGMAVKEPNFTVVGIDAFKPGGHYDLVLFEDIEDQESVNTEELILKTREKDSLAMPMTDKPGAKRITTGTIYHHEDLYCYKVRNYGLARKWVDDDKVEREEWVNDVMRDIEVEIGPGLTETMRVRMFYKPIFKPDQSVLLPSRFTPKQIARIKGSMNESQWARQYLLKPINITNATFLPEDFKYVKKPEGTALYHVLGGDFASSSLKESDDTAFAVVAFNEKGAGTIVETFVGKIKSDEAIRMLFDFHTRYPNLLMALEEDNYVRGWKPDFERQMLQKGVFPTIEWIKAGSRIGKVDRIAGLQSVFRNGGAFLTNECRAVELQGLLFPQGKKDLLDAVANAFQNGREAVLSDRYKHLRVGKDEERVEWEPWKRIARRGNQPYKGRSGRWTPWKAS